MVSPLVALMEDQLFALQRLGVNAAMLSANTEKSELNRVHQSMTDRAATLKLLYVTPEKLAKSKRFVRTATDARPMVAQTVLLRRRML